MWYIQCGMHQINGWKPQKGPYSFIIAMQAIDNGRLFILDFHDILLPFINKMNSLKGRKAYASRTVLFLNDTNILTPIAIELTLPPTRTTPQKKHLYTHGHDATIHWMWKLAKAHVCSNDAGVHQLVNHW